MNHLIESEHEPIVLSKEVGRHHGRYTRNDGRSAPKSRRNMMTYLVQCDVENGWMDVGQIQRTSTLRMLGVLVA